VVLPLVGGGVVPDESPGSAAAPLPLLPLLPPPPMPHDTSRPAAATKAVVVASPALRPCLACMVAAPAGARRPAATAAPCVAP